MLRRRWRDEDREYWSFHEMGSDGVMETRSGDLREPEDYDNHSSYGRVTLRYATRCYEILPAPPTSCHPETLGEACRGR